MKISSHRNAGRAGDDYDPDITVLKLLNKVRQAIGQLDRALELWPLPA